MTTCVRLFYVGTELEPSDLAVGVHTYTEPSCQLLKSFSIWAVQIQSNYDALE